MLPAQERRCEIFSDEFSGKEELDDSAAEALREFLRVMDREKDEPSVGIESALQYEGVPVSVRSQQVLRLDLNETESVGSSHIL